MTVSGVGSQTSLVVQSLVGMRQQLDDLQQQLGTGKKSDTYSGMGLDRGLAVALRNQMSGLGGYDDAITNVNVRINLAQTALGRISDIAGSIKSAALQTNAINSDGSTTSQNVAMSEFTEILGLMNTQAGDRYLFSGRAADQPATDTPDHIMNGDGVRAGFKQVTLERKQADLGATGLGRLVISNPPVTPPANPTAVEVAEDAVSPFGFKIAGVTSNLTGATVTPSGPPTSYTVDLGATNPNFGDTIRYNLTLPDGSSESITLTATTSSPPGPNEFTIGATSTATAANLQTALTASVGKLADTSLTAASALAAANDFFNIDSANPPRRVAGAGPTFYNATALTSGTPANTVTWYTGEAGTDPARDTATVRVDPSINVKYGLRANEEGTRWVLQNVAALAAMTFLPTDPNAPARSTALNQRVAPALDVPAGTQKVSDIEADLSGAQTNLAAAEDRHKQTKSTLADMIDQIEGVSNEDVATKIMTLQTRLQASLATTSLLYKTSLVNYL
jgi:flagellin-like hook-associated protein FlgL